MKKKKTNLYCFLIPAFVAILIGVFFVIGITRGWFDDPKVVVSSEYLGESGLEDITVEEYDEMVKEKKSFILLIDQNGCITAERLRAYVIDFAKENEMKVFRMFFYDMKKTNLNNTIKYYPSVVIIDNGKLRGYMRADANEDADAYNDYEDFKTWMKKYL